MNYELKITNKIIWDKITINAEIYGLESPKKWIRGLLLLYIVVRSKKKKNEKPNPNDAPLWENTTWFT